MTGVTATASQVPPPWRDRQRYTLDFIVRFSIGELQFSIEAPGNTRQLGASPR